VVLGGALQLGVDVQTNARTSPADPVALNGRSVGCRVEPRVSQITLAEALYFGCPVPLAELGERLGSDRLTQLYRDYRLTEAPDLVISTAADDDPSIANPALAAIGQDRLTVTPLHMALVTAALAGDGSMPAAQLVLSTQARSGQWEAESPARLNVAPLAARFAVEVRSVIGGGYSASAATGEPGQGLAWFLGFTPRNAPRYAVAVLLESGGPAEAAAIGRTVLGATASSP
jgi:peptidoglycan glycosyltransferase